MRLTLCTILDTVAGVYCRPFCARSDGEAQRIFAAMCKSDETVSKAPSDYKLFVVGTFDEVSGELASVTPRQLMHGDAEVEVTMENGRRPGALRRFLSGKGGGR